MSEPLFSYCTLQLAQVQQAVFGRMIVGSDDVLHGFAIVQVTIGDPGVLQASGIEVHDALVPDPEAAPIPGKVFDLTAAELAQADIYETEHYRRTQVSLASGRTSWVYIKA